MKSNQWFSAILLTGALTGVLAACSHKTDTDTKMPESPPADETAPSPNPEPPAAAPTADPTSPTSSNMAPPTIGDQSTSGQTSAAPAQAPTPPPLNDDQIAAITDAANTGEIEQAKLAQKKSKDARVKKFAAMMINHHTQAKQKQSKILSRIELAPVENANSTSLAAESNQILATLKDLNGAEFDRAYIDFQIQEHKKVLDAFDNQLIPNAKNPDLKTALQDFRPKVEEHLKEAQAIQQDLATASTGRGSSTGTAGPAMTSNGQAGTGAPTEPPARR